MVSCTFPHPYASNKALEGKKKQYKILTPKFPTPPYKAIVCIYLSYLGDIFYLYVPRTLMYSFI